MLNTLKISKKASLYFFINTCLFLILQTVQVACFQYRWVFIGCLLFEALILNIGAAGGSLLPLLLSSYTASLFGCLQGLYPSMYVAFMIGTSHAIAITLFMVNINRSIILGIIFSAALKAGYLMMLLAVGAFSTLPNLPAWNCLFAYRLFGLNQFFITLVAGLLSSPILFCILFSQKEISAG